MAHHPLACKWDRYYAAGSAPFDSGRPASQLVHFLCSCMAEHRLCHGSNCPPEAAAIAEVAARAAMHLPAAPDAATAQPHTCSACAHVKPPAGSRALELGCGTGASARWLAQQGGFRVTAVDVSQVALQAAAAAAAAAGLPADNPTWLLQDIMELSTPQHKVQPPNSTHDCMVQPRGVVGAPAAGDDDVRVGDDSAARQQRQALQESAIQPGPLDSAFDFIYDCQVYHVLVRDQPGCLSRLPQLLHDLLQPGGLLMILAGNAGEPEVGPNTLTAQELLMPLLSVGLELVMLLQTRFDSTEHYIKVLGKRPLAWWAVLQRPRCIINP